MLGPEFIEFVAVYGIWVVAGFIALESIGIPLPAEATLIAAAFFSARTQDLNIWLLLCTGVLAAFVGDVAGFWIGRVFGRRLLESYGARVGLTEPRLRIGQWLFARYGGRFVFVARFLPVLRNMAAALAGTNRMSPCRFYFAGGMSAIAWVSFYGLSAYSFGEAFNTLASSAAVSLAGVAAVVVLGLPTLILRYEKRLLARAEIALPARPPAS